jgi:hypothetical protein
LVVHEEDIVADGADTQHRGLRLCGVRPVKLSGQESHNRRVKQALHQDEA